MTLQFLLDELPAVIAGAPREQLPALIAHLAALQSTVAARLLNGHEAPDPLAVTPNGKEQWLTVEQVTAQYAVTEQWLYRHKRHLPHSQPSRKVLLFPEEKLRKWFASRKSP